MAETIVIGSEQEAWSCLRGLIDGTIEAEDIVLDFGQSEWAGFEAHFKGPRFDQTLTLPVMTGLIEYQKALYRAVAMVLKGDPRITRLTDDEKDAFELTFKVKEGSTGIFAAAKEVLELLGGKVFERMTSRDIAVCIIIIALLFFGYQGFNAYLNHNVEIAKLETQQKRDESLTDIIRQLAPTKEPEVDILNDAIEAVPSAGVIRDEVSDAYEAIVRNAHGVSELSIQGRTINASAISHLTQATRRTAEKVTLKGLFTVSNVDTRLNDGFLVRFEQTDGSLDITANIGDAILAERYRKVIERATFNKKAIRVTIAARKLGDKYLDAEVLKASTPRTA